MENTNIHIINTKHTLGRTQVPWCGTLSDWYPSERLLPLDSIRPLAWRNSWRPTVCRWHTSSHGPQPLFHRPTASVRQHSHNINQYNLGWHRLFRQKSYMEIVYKQRKHGRNRKAETEMVNTYRENDRGRSCNENTEDGIKGTKKIGRLKEVEIFYTKRQRQETGDRESNHKTDKFG